MSNTNKRELALEYIRETTVPLINGTGEYDLNIKTVSREMLDPTNLRKQEFPAVIITDDALTMYEPLTAEEYTTGTSIEGLTNGFPVVLIGIIKLAHVNKIDKAGALSTEMNKIRKDLILAMHNDISLGSNVLSVVLKSSLNSMQYAESDDVGVVVVTFVLKYDFNPRASNPSV